MHLPSQHSYDPKTTACQAEKQKSSCVRRRGLFLGPGQVPGFVGRQAPRPDVGNPGSQGAGGAVVPVAFPRPGPNWYKAHHGKPQISLFVIVARLRGGASLDDLFRPDRRDLMGAFIVPMDFQIAPPADSVSEATTIGLWRDLEERWRFFLSGLGGSDMHHH